MDTPKTLLLSNGSLPAARPLAASARRRGWLAASLDERAPAKDDRSGIVFYGSTLAAAEVARRYHLALRTGTSTRQVEAPVRKASDETAILLRKPQTAFGNNGS